MSNKTSKFNVLAASREVHDSVCESRVDEALLSGSLLRQHHKLMNSVMSASKELFKLGSLEGVKHTSHLSKEINYSRALDTMYYRHQVDEFFVGSRALKIAKVIKNKGQYEVYVYDCVSNENISFKVDSNENLIKMFILVLNTSAVNALTVIEDLESAREVEIVTISSLIDPECVEKMLS